MNKKLVLLLAAIFLAGAVGVSIPAQAEVSGPFGYDLQKDIHRNKNKTNQQNNMPQKVNGEETPILANTNVTDEDIFTDSVNFNKVYYPNATMKSAIIKYKNGNYTGSLQELYTIVKKEPKNAAAYYYVGMAYTKVGGVEQAKAAYQKVINLNSNSVLVDYAQKAQNCLVGNANCAAVNAVEAAGDILPEEDALDKFIAAPYGNGLSPEMNEQYRQQQLNAIQNKINSGQTLSPEDLQKMRELQNKSEVSTGDKLAFAGDKKKVLLMKKF